MLLWYLCLLPVKNKTLRLSRIPRTLRRNSPRCLWNRQTTLLFSYHSYRFARHQLFCLWLWFLGRFLHWVDPVKPACHPYGPSPSVHKTFLWLAGTESSLACRSMSTTRWYTIWRDPGSRSSSRDLQKLEILPFSQCVSSAIFSGGGAGKWLVSLNLFGLDLWHLA